jgi:hypothetical protein
MCTYSRQPQAIPVRFGAPRQDGIGENNQSYRFGWGQRASRPYPISTRQYARLLTPRRLIQSEWASEDACEDGCWPPPAA